MPETAACPEQPALDRRHGESCYHSIERFMKCLHVPLPDRTYTQLRVRAERARMSTTNLAREAIDSWLRAQLRKARHDEIASYAMEMAGTGFDFDPNLESAGIERLVSSSTKRQ